VRATSLIRILLLAAVAAMVGVWAGCGGDDDGDKSASTTDAGATANADGKCEKVQKPPPRKVRDREPPDFRLERGKTYIAKVETSCGDFTIKLDPKDAPKTGGSFVTLAREKFYDGLTFHRVVPGYVIQGGDPRGIGIGGPGYQIREKPPEDLAYSQGVVAMAKTGQEPPGTSGSQFFVVTATDANLPPDYALLGEVQDGFETVRRIELIPPGQNEQPVLPVVIRRIRISEK
jgi:peptidyl-prolyl cis-trans isomerase B (cyclophilin B)